MTLNVFYRRKKVNWWHFGYEFLSGFWIKLFAIYEGDVYGNVFESDKGDYVVISQSDATQIKRQGFLDIIIDRD